MTSASKHCLFAALAWLCTAPASSAQLPSSPAPASYQVKLRYYINASRDLHIALYDELIAHLQSLAFQFTPPLDEQPKQNRENPYKNDMSGTIAGDKALAILKNSSVATMLLVPDGFMLPAGDQPVTVRLQLAGGLPFERQRELRNQTLAMLQQLGFREGAGYDTRGYGGVSQTRLLGTVLAGQLDLLLKDLRRQPTGWLAPLVHADELPVPLRNVVPITVIEVLADAAPTADVAFPEPRPENALYKLAADLWDIVKQPDKQAETLRVQIILSYRPDFGDTHWRQQLAHAAPSLFIEGQMDQFVTGLASVREIARLAALPEVSVVRLPRLPLVQVDPGVRFKTDNQAIFEKTGLEGLHNSRFRGKGTRVAIIDADFRGWTKMVQDRYLPARTRLLDLTAEQNPDIYPLPMDGDEVGHGTQAALAAALAAPQAEFVLVRINPADPYQLQRVLDFTQGRPFSNDLQRRQDEILAERGRLRSQRDELLQERKRILEDFDDDLNNERDFGFLGAARGWVFSEREWHRQWVEYHESQEKIVAERQVRLTRLLDEVLNLKGTQIVANSFAWNSGYPMGGTSPLSRYFNERLGNQPLWFQSVGNTRGQCWHGYYRDDNGDAAMEFAAPGARLPAGRWSSEINFLAWQVYEEKPLLDLPAPAKIRVSLQWREPHDPEHFTRPGVEDPYALPLAELRLLVLRQRDPDAKTLPADVFEVAARSFGLPQRLDNQPSSATYEIAAEFTVDKPGRYAVRVERQGESQWLLANDASGKPQLRLLRNLTPTSTRPLGETFLPASPRTWELYPRVFVECIDDQASRLGRPIFADYATDLATLGMPADARRVVAVGACNLSDQPQPYTAAGAPMNRPMAKAPVVFMYDALRLGPDGFGPAYGNNLAAPLAAGVAATALSSGVAPEQFLYHVRQRYGKVLHASGR